MRKNKTFEVYLIDKSASATGNYSQTNDATFYTSDTEAYLNFKPADMAFDFTQATVALLNTTDQSLVSKPATVNKGVAEYELPADVIAHWGTWQVQVIFTSENENYTSGLMTFKVERYLLDERPPRLEDVENVSLLISQATEIMEELERALASFDTDKYDNHVANDAIHVTQANKNTWNNKQNTLTSQEKEDFQRYTIANNDGNDNRLTLEVVSGQPRIKIEEA